MGAANCPRLLFTGGASTRATVAIKLDRDDTYGRWHVMQNAPTGVVR